MRGQWPRAAVLLAAVGASCLAAAPLDILAHNYHDKPSAAAHAAVLAYANAHPRDTSGALALLVAGAGEMDAHQYKDALTHLRAAEKRLPMLADYPAYLKSAAEYQLNDFDGSRKDLKPVWDNSPASPLAVKATILEANAYIQSGDPKKAIRLLEQRGADVPPEKTSLLLGKAYEAGGDRDAALVQYQRVFTEFPRSPEAADAQAALASFPALSVQARLLRSRRLIEGRENARAEKELRELIPTLSGEDRDQAQVLLGASYCLGRDWARASAQLKAIQVTSADAAAERLFYLAQVARHFDRVSDLNAALGQLQAAYPASKWRLQALVEAGNYYVTQNDSGQAEPLFRTCYESFSSDPQASYCQWRAGWVSYLRDRSKGDQFVTHLKQWPASEHASAALYYLGRIAEAQRDPGAARLYYERASGDYPNQYYGVLARDRLTAGGIAGATPSQQAAGFLATIPRQRAPAPDWRPSSVTQSRIDRARLLVSAGLDDLADSELRYGARHDGQPQVEAMELARIASDRNEPHQGIRWIKHYAPDYLSLPLNPTTEAMWRLAFPLPFRKPLTAFAEARNLDPYLLAALIRQESEFNPNVVSYANAYGLAQVMPATGRELSRRLNIRPFQTKMLFTPEVNLNIGSYYLRVVLDSLAGKYEAALASYNAGKSRVVKWLGWNDFQEPAEFVESIPILQTRDYVQNVLRNADVYRRLYGASATVKTQAAR